MVEYTISHLCAQQVSLPLNICRSAVLSAPLISMLQLGLPYRSIRLSGHFELVEVRRANATYRPSVVVAQHRSFLGIARALRNAADELRTDGRNTLFHQV